MNTSVKGKAGEILAARYLEEKGYAIAKTNFRYGRGEVDIIATHNECVIFAEVKTWDAYDYGEIGRSVDSRKRRRIIMASRGFLNQHPEFDNWCIQFDVLFIHHTGREVKHITNAFMETDAL